MDNLQVGGRNILVNSDFLRETYGWVIESTTMTYKVVDDDKVGKYLSLKSTAAGNVSGNRIYQINFANGDTGHIANQVYSLSFYAKTTSTTAVGIHAGWVSGLKTLSISGTTWKRYAVTYTTTGTGSMTIYIDKANTELHIAQIKLEKGNKATDWTPAPEDIESSITEVSDKQSSMQLDLDGFKTSVSNTYATKTQLNTVDGKFANYSTTTQMNTAINQSASNIKLEASKTYATKNELTGKVDTSKVVSAINVSPESIKIQSSKITLEGIVTANSRFKILADGSMEAVNGKFSGTITASNGKIAGWNIDTMNIYKETESDGYVYRSQVTCSTSLSTGVVFGISRIKDNNREWMFYVAPDGRLYATKASIVGSITATSGTFKGTVSASTITGSTISGGTIKGASISGGSITSNTTINVSTNLTIGNSIYIGSYSDRNTQKYIYFNDRFIVTSRNDILAIGLNNGDPFKGKVYVNTSGGITVRGTNAVNLVSDANVYSKASGSIDMESTGYLQLRSTGGGLKLQTGSMIIYFENSGIGISSNNFRPAEACIGSIAFGTSKYLYYRFYAREGIYQPSDIRMKTNIKEYDERFENMYMDLKPITYQWKNDIGRSHCGLIAQWTKNAMDKHGIDEREFGAYEHDRKEDTYGITYTELPSLNMHMIQKTIMRVDTHDKEIAELKSEIIRLQSKLDAYVNGTLEIKRA